MDNEKLSALEAEFYKTAERAKTLLEGFVSNISKGYIPNKESLDSFDTYMSLLRHEYDKIYEQALKELNEKELPKNGSSINDYFEALRNSRSRRLRGEIEFATRVIIKFISLKTNDATLNDSLVEQQVIVKQCLENLAVSELERVKEDVSWIKRFLDAVDAAKNNTLDYAEIEKLQAHYGNFLIFGILRNSFYFEDDDSVEIKVAQWTDKIMKIEAAVPTEYESDGGDGGTTTSPEEGVSQKKLDQSLGSNANTNETVTIVKSYEDVELPDVIDVNKDGEQTALSIVKEHTDQEVDCQQDNKIQYISHSKQKSVSVSSFKRDVAKINKGFPEIALVLPILSKIGIMTKEQAYYFVVSTGFKPDTEKSKYDVEKCIDHLWAKGFLDQLSSDDGNDKLEAYCLSSHTLECLMKNSMMQGKNVWPVSFGNYCFKYNKEMTLDEIKYRLDENSKLYRYLYGMRQSLPKQKQLKIVESVRRVNDEYYIVMVPYNESFYACRLLTQDHYEEPLKEENLLFSSETPTAKWTIKDGGNRIFAHYEGIIQCSDDAVEATQDGDSEVTEVAINENDFTNAEDNVAENTESSSEMIIASELENIGNKGLVEENFEQDNLNQDYNIAKEKAISETQTSVIAEKKVEASSVFPDSQKTSYVDGHKEVEVEKSNAPSGLKEKIEFCLNQNATPDDEEFCQLVSEILNAPSGDRDINPAVVRAVVLAKCAATEGDYPEIQKLSKQLSLATHLLVKDLPYTHNTILSAFNDYDKDSNVLLLCAILMSLLTPGQSYDYGLREQIERYFKDYEEYFYDLPQFKPLFNKMREIKDVLETGFTPAIIAALGTDEQTNTFLQKIQLDAKNFLETSPFAGRLRHIPIAYRVCFGDGSDFYSCMKTIVDNKTDQGSVDFVKIVADDFTTDGSVDDKKIAEFIDRKWFEVTQKKGYQIQYIYRERFIRHTRGHVNTILEWLSHIDILQQQNVELIAKGKKLREDIIELINNIRKDSKWKQLEHSSILAWMLMYISAYLNNEISRWDIYHEVLLSGYLNIDETGEPEINHLAKMNVQFYEPWRNALKYIVADKKDVNTVKDEILGNINVADVDKSLRDNLRQFRLISKYLDNTDDGDVNLSAQEIDAKAFADDYCVKFKERLELAYTYNQINEIEKETLYNLMEQYKDYFYDLQDFACWRWFLNALSNQIEAISKRKEHDVQEMLNMRLDEVKNHKDSVDVKKVEWLKAAQLLLDKDKNFAVVEEYINRFDIGGTDIDSDVDMEQLQKSFNQNLFREFVESDLVNNDIYNECQKRKGNHLKTFGTKFIEQHRPSEWRARHKENSEKMISAWPTRKSVTTTEQIKNVFTALGMNVLNVEKNITKTNIAKTNADCFKVYIKPDGRNKSDYSHPIASFGTRVKPPLNVVVLYGNSMPKEIVDTMSDFNFGDMAVVLADGYFNLTERRQIGEIFHNETTGQNPFLLIDRVLYLYLAMHQSTERLPAMLACTLPFTTYQPFVRDGGSTADEMFVGRTKELATIMDPKGAVVVYGGRQLGKTALLERAESRCSNPNENKFAVYSTIVRNKTEKDVVETLIIAIANRTEGKIQLTKCDTIKEMCQQLRELFSSKKIVTLHLFIDEVDDFLKAISSVAYEPLQPLVDLRREMRDSFKFVIAGLHNVCRAKNAISQNGIFGQLGTPLCIKPLTPMEGLELLSKPLKYLGFQIERYPHLETILTNTNYYPGILQFFGYMLVETLTSKYSAYYSAADGHPPFTLIDDQLGAVMNSADLNKSIKDKFRLSLELDPRYFMLVRCITWLYHDHETDISYARSIGFTVEQIKEVADIFEIVCLKDENENSFTVLLDEMVEMGILSNPVKNTYRLRRRSFVDIIGENMETIEAEIASNNEVDK